MGDADNDVVLVFIVDAQEFLSTSEPGKIPMALTTLMTTFLTQVKFLVTLTFKEMLLLGSYLLLNLIY